MGRTVPTVAMSDRVQRDAAAGAGRGVLTATSSTVRVGTAS